MTDRSTNVLVLVVLLVGSAPAGVAATAAAPGVDHGAPPTDSAGQATEVTAVGARAVGGGAVGRGAVDGGAVDEGAVDADILDGGVVEGGNVEGHAVTEIVAYNLTPGDPDHVTVTVRYLIDDTVAGLHAALPSTATDLSLGGFDRIEGRDRPSVEWDRSTDSPRVRFRLPMDGTLGVEHGPDDGDTWALVANLSELVGTHHRQYGGEWIFEGARERTTADVPFHVGDEKAFLGGHDVRRTSARGRQFLVVVPEAASPTANLSNVTGTLRYAAREYRVGNPDGREITVFVRPAPLEDNGYAIGPTGRGGDIVVGADERVATRNAWIHEYVHTEQWFGATNETEWLVEATAMYYSRLLSLRAGNGSYSRFAAFLRADSDESAVLATPDEWGSDRVPYSKGGRVVAALDVRIRNATDGARTMMDVMRRLNAHEGNVTHADVERIVADVAGVPMDEWLHEHVHTSAPVSAPTGDPFRYTDPHGESDADGDGLTAAEERQQGTHPFQASDPGTATPPPSSTPKVATGTDSSAEAGTATRNGGRTATEAGDGDDDTSPSELAGAVVVLGGIGAAVLVGGFTVLAALAKLVARLSGRGPAVLVDRSLLRLGTLAVLLAVVGFGLGAVILG